VKFLRVPITEAAGCVLAHNVHDARDRCLFKKGALLSTRDIARIMSLGRDFVYVAKLEPGDIGEDEAARRIAAAVTGPGTFSPGAATGRANVKAATAGLLRINVEAIHYLNDIDDGITVATLSTCSCVRASQMVATIKIIPFAVSQNGVEEVERFAGTVAPILTVTALPARKVGLIVTAFMALPQKDHRDRDDQASRLESRVTNSTRESLCLTATDQSQHELIAAEFAPALLMRLERLGSSLHRQDFAEHEVEAIARAIGSQLAAGCEMILIVGMTAIIDRHDVVPSAIEMAGGVVEHFGVPVDPGNLLLVAYRGSVPILGVPGCARSPKTNAFDLVLPRLLAGERITRRDLVRLGHGGLLEKTHGSYHK
jgi:molybdenum cofactor cytidylyltransferase